MATLKVISEKPVDTWFFTWPLDIDQVKAYVDIIALSISGDGYTNWLQLMLKLTEIFQAMLTFANCTDWRLHEHDHIYDVPRCTHQLPNSNDSYTISLWKKPSCLIKPYVLAILSVNFQITNKQEHLLLEF